jgi:enamine deaminase RidA (YjgF/YER057c/UK114 family)
MSSDERFVALGFVVPARPVLPPGIHLPFEWVNVVGERCITSGHGALDPDGRPMGPFGRVPDEVSVEDARRSAHHAAVALVAALRSALGSLDRVRQFVMLDVLVNAKEGFAEITTVANPISDLVLEVFGTAGAHARTAVGVTALPMNFPVAVSAEVLVTP